MACNEPDGHQDRRGRYYHVSASVAVLDLRTGEELSGRIVCTGNWHPFKASSTCRRKRH